MFVNAKLVAIVALFVAAAQAAENATSASSAAIPSSTAGVSPCILSCSQDALTSSKSKCPSFADPCICTDTAFQAAAAQCLTSKCTAADQEAAVSLEKQLCASAGNSTTGGNSTSTGSSNKTSSGTSSSTSSASSSSKSSAASAQVEFGMSGVIALGVAVAGAAVGGLII